jgi:hypothetical protein
MVVSDSPDRIASELPTGAQLHSLIAQSWDELKGVSLAEPSWESQGSEGSRVPNPSVDLLQGFSWGVPSCPDVYTTLRAYFARGQDKSLDFRSNVIESRAVLTESAQDRVSSDNAEVTLTRSWESVLRRYVNTSLRPRLTDMPLSMQIKYLEVAYAFAGRPETKSFIETHQHIVRLLYAAVPPLRKAFPGSRFTLRVDGVPNPGIEQSPEALLVTIWTKVDPAEALACLHGFYTSWWLECQSFARGQLCFDVGFE